MLPVIVLPIVILGVGALLAVRGHTRNRALTLGATVILAALGAAAVIIHHPMLL